MKKFIALFIILTGVYAVVFSQSETVYKLPNGGSISIPGFFTIPVGVDSATARTIDSRYYIMTIFSHDPNEYNWVFIFDLWDLKSSPNLPIPRFAMRSEKFDGTWVFRYDPVTKTFAYNAFVINGYKTIIMNDNFQPTDTIECWDPHLLGKKFAAKKFGTEFASKGTVGVQTLATRSIANPNQIIDYWSAVDSVHGIPDIINRSYALEFNTVQELDLGNGVMDYGHLNSYSLSFLLDNNGDITDTIYWANWRHIGITEVKKGNLGDLTFTSMFRDSDPAEQYDDYTWVMVDGKLVKIRGAHGFHWCYAYGDTIEGVIWNNNVLSNPPRSQLVAIRLIRSTMTIYSKVLEFPTFGKSMGSGYMVLRPGEVDGHVRMFDDFENRQFALNHGTMEGAFPFSLPDRPHGGIVYGDGTMLFKTLSSSDRWSIKNVYETSCANIPVFDSLTPIISMTEIGDSLILEVENKNMFSAQIEWVTGDVGYRISVPAPTEPTMFVCWSRTTNMTLDQYIFGTYYYAPKTIDTTSVHIIDGEENIRIFPNPIQVGNIIRIDSDQAIDIVEVFNNIGQKMPVIWDDNQIHTDGLVPGMYIITLNQKTKFKIIVTK